MVYVQDNFLPEPLFLWLNEKSLIKSKESYQLAENKSDANFAKFHKTDKTGWDLTYRNLNGSLEIPTQVIGDKVPDIINLLINTIENKTQKPVLPIDNIHFLFTRTGYVVKHHIDRTFKHSSPKRQPKLILIVLLLSFTSLTQCSSSIEYTINLLG